MQLYSSRLPLCQFMRRSWSGSLRLQRFSQIGVPRRSPSMLSVDGNAPPGTNRPRPSGSLRTYIAEHARVDDETRRLTALFVVSPRYLKLSICRLSHMQRLRSIAHSAQRPGADTGAHHAYPRVRRQLLGISPRVPKLWSAALARFLGTLSRERGDKGFGVRRVRELAGRDGAQLLAALIEQLLPLALCRNRLLRNPRYLKRNAGRHQHRNNGRSRCSHWHFRHTRSRAQRSTLLAPPMRRPIRPCANISLASSIRRAIVVVGKSFLT